MKAETVLSFLFASAALLGLVVAFVAMRLVVAADPLWGSISLMIAGALVWILLRRCLRWLRRAGAECEAFGSQRS